ncbi:hypothetical protein H3005_20770 [Stenotrophomonas sp. Br8]|uniref:hypothetical protein n=1 Tax=Stenotrophomonas sp. Br8 TaxID=2759658 RepID=UPI00168BCE8A|nr:hypothetical protein [Stenotrophomonas sp. Br8]MBD3684290.1 hypothetical protein [Stenotrophomonas sp. Br8]
MNVHTYAASSRTEIDDRLADAQAKAKTYGDIEQWALRSIPDPELRHYCMERAEQLLAK